MKKGIKIRQHDSYDCGAACLSCVAAWHGLYLPLAEVRRLCGCTKEGITIKGIIEGAERLGIAAEAFKSQEKSINTLKGADVKLPAIAHLRKENGFFHFVTIINISDKYIEVMEPSCGEIEKVPYKEFIEEWTGFIILLSPKKEFKRGNRQGNLYKRLLLLLACTRKEILHSLAGSCMIVAIGILNPLFLQHIIDNIIPARQIRELLWLSAIIATLTILMLFLSYSKNIYLAMHGMRVDNKLIYSYIQKVFTLPAEYFAQYTAGDLNSRVSDAFNIRLFISEGVISVLISAVTLSASLVIIFNFNSTLATLSLLFIPLHAGLFFLSGSINKKYNRELAVTGARFETDMLQGMEGITSIRHYGAENLSIKRIEESYCRLAHKIFDASKAVTQLGIASDSLSNTLMAATLIAGGFMIFGNTLSVGELVAFYTLCSFFSSPLNNLTKMNSVITQAVVSAQRLFEITDIATKESESPANHTIDSNWKQIRIEGVDFHYPGRESLFEDFGISIQRGSITAITGKSGCGKSTLASLLMRDYEPLGGALYLDNCNINLIPKKEWLNFITIVPQKVHMFNASLLENITCGEKQPDIERVVSICAESGLGELIQSMPMGLLTNIGESGSTLSGGEMQKLAIARGIYKNPQVFIFDESTSSVEKESEVFILQHIKRLKQSGKTIIIITHNVNILEYADNVIKI